MRKIKKLEQISAQKFEQVPYENLGRVRGAGSLTFIQGEHTYITVNTDIVGHGDAGDHGCYIINC